MKTLHSLIAGLRPAYPIIAQRIAFPLLCLGAGLALVQPCMSAPFQFEETGRRLAFWQTFGPFICGKGRRNLLFA